MITVDDRMEAIYGGNWQYSMAYVKAIKVVYENLKEMQAEIDATKKRFSDFVDKHINDCAYEEIEI